MVASRDVSYTHIQTFAAIFVGDDGHLAVLPHLGFDPTLAPFLAIRDDLDSGDVAGLSDEFLDLGDQIGPHGVESFYDLAQEQRQQWNTTRQE